MFSLNETKLLKMNKVSDKEFLEWLRGFIDAEGCFSIFLNKQYNSFSFRFQIGLHIDDRSVLEYICNRLKLGRVTNYSNKSAAFIVTKQNEILELIKILNLEVNPLNTIKHLNYLNWKEAFLKYIDPNYSNKDIDIILNLKNNMNKSRKDFNHLNSHKINITPYWLVGFIEGDGSFFIKRIKYLHSLTLSQIQTEKNLMLELVNYLNKLAVGKLLNSKINGFANLNFNPASGKGNEQASYKLNITNFEFISLVLIPFFDNLIFFTKKYEDYKDWKIVALLKLEGKHLTPEGKTLINHICNRMNNNRLSTNLNTLNTLNDKEMANINDKIKILLEKPSFKKLI